VRRCVRDEDAARRLDLRGGRRAWHEAADEGRIAARNALDPSRSVEFARRTPLTIVFTDPQIALVGRTWASLEGEDFAQGSVSYADQGRAQVLGVARGRARIYEIAVELVRHSVSRFEQHELAAFLDSYQRVAPLTMGELWAWPSMLTLALVENLRRLAEEILGSRRARTMADEHLR